MPTLLPSITLLRSSLPCSLPIRILLQYITQARSVRVKTKVEKVNAIEMVRFQLARHPFRDSWDGLGGSNPSCARLGSSADAPSGHVLDSLVIGLHRPVRSLLLPCKSLVEQGENLGHIKLHIL